jgi:hypothetical protein
MNCPSLELQEDDVTCLCVHREAIVKLCFTQEKELSTGPSVIFDLFPRPQAQISNHGRACTQALLLYIG